MIAYTAVERLLIGGGIPLHNLDDRRRPRDLTRHEWALVITAVVTLAAIAVLALIALGKGWL